MKIKSLALLMTLVMLIMLASCFGTPGDTENSSNEASSSAVSSDNEVTEAEIEALVDAYIECAESTVVDQSYKGTVTRIINGEKTVRTVNSSMLINVSETSNQRLNTEIYSDYGIEQRKRYYYTATEGYLIVEQGNTKYGYKWEMPEDFTIDSEEEFPTDNISEGSAVRNVDGGITYTYSGEDAFYGVAGFLTVGSYFADNEEGYETHNTDVYDENAEFSVTVDKDMKVTAVKVKVTFTEKWNGELNEEHQVEIEVDLTVNSYGENADVVVPVPDDLDICESI